MAPSVINDLVLKHVEEEFSKLNSKNVCKAEALHSGNWWLADPKHWNFEAGARAVKRVFGVEPDYTREGGSIPVTLTFSDSLKKNVMLLPMGRKYISTINKIGRGDDGAHSTVRFRG